MPNREMKILLHKCLVQLKDHMTPDDLAATIKAERGVKIFENDGDTFHVLGKAWWEIQSAFRNALKEPWSGGREETLILNEKLEEISKTWDTYASIIGTAKCNLETN